MSLDHSLKDKVIQFADMSGGANINDPPMSLVANQVVTSRNALLLARGFKRWPGAVNVTAEDACSDYLRGLFHHSTVAGTQYLYVVFGQKLYSINKSTGALTELYTLSGDGAAWGGSHYGTFFMANGSDVVKVEGSTAYKVGMSAPTGATSALVAGGTLPDGEYQIYLSHTRQVSGVDVLYSVGQSVTARTCGSGDNTIRITFSDASASDPQITHVTVWMAGPSDSSTFYKYGSAAIGAGTVDIASTAAKNTALTYSAYAQNNYRPGNFEFLLAHENRIWGSIGNYLYYSQKGATKYDLEKFPALNVIEYPYRIRGLFSCGRHLCINTYENGVIVQPNADVTAKYEHYEKGTSFLYMRTVDDWNGRKIGLTGDRLGVFDPVTMTFEPWDYGYNIRPVLEKIWAATDGNHEPCGIVNRRGNRIEYMLSFMDTDINSVANNRTWVLNLSRTQFFNIDQYKTPWEEVCRGFNFACIDSGKVLYMGQSFNASSTVYKELSTHTTEVGIYGDAGTYISTATAMALRIVSRTIIENLFTRVTIENIRAMFIINDSATLDLVIVDDPSKLISQAVDMAAYGESVWDTMEWDTDSWASGSQQMYQFKGKMGVNGYSWNLAFSQTDDDITMKVTQFDVHIQQETGRMI